MKKRTLKTYPCLLFLFAVLTVFVFLLSSCAMLDGMREAHAVWNNAEKTEILYQGNVYRLWEGENLLDKSGSVSIDLWNAKQINVTPSDVPVLLSTTLNEPGNGVYLVNSVKTVIAFEGYANRDYYFREDVFDSFGKAISSDPGALLTGYCIDSRGKPVLMDGDGVKRMKELVASLPLKEFSPGDLAEKAEYFWFNVYQCDPTMTFLRPYVSFSASVGRDDALLFPAIDPEEAVYVFTSYIDGKVCLLDKQTGDAFGEIFNGLINKNEP